MLESVIVTLYSWPTLHGPKLTLQTKAGNISTLTNIMVRQLSKEKAEVTIFERV